jgi:hypothetical protein
MAMAVILPEGDSGRGVGDIIKTNRQKWAESLEEDQKAIFTSRKVRDRFKKPVFFCLVNKPFEASLSCSPAGL